MSSLTRTQAYRAEMVRVWGYFVIIAFNPDVSWRNENVAVALEATQDFEMRFVEKP